VPRRYAVEFRRKVLDLIEAGKPAEVAAQLGVSDQTIYNWRSQDQIDRGRVGSSTSESAALTAAKKRIRELETELAVTKRANELLKAQTDPKGGGRSSRKL
jgi:transposase